MVKFNNFLIFLLSFLFLNPAYGSEKIDLEALFSLKVNLNFENTPFQFSSSSDMIENFRAFQDWKSEMGSHLQIFQKISKTLSMLHPDDFSTEKFKWEPLKSPEKEINFRQLRNVGRWSAICALEEFSSGNIEKGFLHCQRLHTLSLTISGSPSSKLIDLMIGLSIKNLASKALMDPLLHPNFPFAKEEDRKKLAGMIKKWEDLPQLLSNCLLEESRTTQRLLDLPPEKFMEEFSLKKQFDPEIKSASKEEVDKMFQVLSDLIQKSPNPRKTAKGLALFSATFEKGETGVFQTFFSSLMMPNVARAYNQLVKCQIFSGGVRWAALKTLGLKQEPDMGGDPWSDGGLHPLRVNDNERSWILYSVGPDGIDQKGSEEPLDVVLFTRIKN